MNLCYYDTSVLGLMLNTSGTIMFNFAICIPTGFRHKQRRSPSPASVLLLVLVPVQRQPLHLRCEERSVQVNETPSMNLSMDPLENLVVNDVASS